MDTIGGLLRYFVSGSLFLKFDASDCSLISIASDSVWYSRARFRQRSATDLSALLFALARHSSAITRYSAALGISANFYILNANQTFRSVSEKKSPGRSQG